MENITAVVIDDEEAARENIKDALLLYSPHVAISGEAGSITEAIAVIKQARPQLIFIDINLGAHTGFDVLDAVDIAGCAIIFITAYDQYAIRAFKYAAVDYLLKPIISSELINAVKQAEQRLVAGSTHGQLGALKTDLSKKLKEKKLYLSTRAGAEIISASNILFIKAEGSYSRIVMAGGKEIIASRLLRLFEEELAGESNFLRVHKSYIANIEMIKSLSTKAGGSIIFINNVEIPATYFDLIRERIEGL